MTVFLALLLSCFLAVSGVLTDYARAQLLSAKVQDAVSAAAESVFAGYHAPLFGRYQLLARQMTDGSEEKLNQETCTYTDAWGCGGLLHVNLGGFKTEKAEWSGLVHVTDENGVVFRQMTTQAFAAAGLRLLDSYADRHLGFGNPAISSTMAQHNAESDSRSSTLFPRFSEVQEKIREAEKAEEEQKRREQEALAQWKEAEKAAIEAGTEPPPKPEIHEPTEEEKKLQADRKEGAKYWKLLGTVRTLLFRGVLAVVLPEGAKVSEGRIPTDSLPSKLSASVRSRSVRGGNTRGMMAFAGYLGNIWAFREYLMANLDCYTSETDKSPGYEMEYVIAGKSTDRKNLESVVMRILALRIALNLMYLRTSPEKLGATKAAAALIIGWTGQLYLIEPLAGLLLTAWAGAESLADVRSLLAGKRVPLMKQDKDWQLSLEHAAKEWSQTDEDSDDPGALSYEEYLRILLTLNFSLENQTYRAMDVVQWNIRKIDRDFRIDQCFVEGKLKVTAVSGVIFTPMYGGMLRRGFRGKMRWEKNSGYSYMRIGG